jgi:hypothetical protein
MPAAASQKAQANAAAISFYIQTGPSNYWPHQRNMKTTIDFKSALCGLIIGVLAMLALGAETTASSTGRYQVSAASGLGIILDTKTGRAWGFGPISTAQYRTDNDFWAQKDEKQ